MTLRKLLSEPSHIRTGGNHDKKDGEVRSGCLLFGVQHSSALQMVKPEGEHRVNLDPQKFFIGLMDFFSILLPGALLTYLLKDDMGLRLLGDEYSNLGDAEKWMVFLFSSYLLGHFIFLLGSWLLDDHLYDPIRKATYKEQIKRLANGKQLSSRLIRMLTVWLVKTDADNAVSLAVRVKEHYLDPLNASSAINAFQWCKAKLTLEHPEAMATVQRFEADSKFFRSLLIVLCVLILLGLVESRPVITLVSMALLVLAFWRYVDQRVKATSQAYWYVITLEGQREGGYRQPPPDQAHRPSHAGGVVYRRVKQQVQYLMVRASKTPQEWVLPKGHIEAGEPMPETAVREVREETGVWARIITELERISFAIDGKSIEVQFYLMEALEEGDPSDLLRKHVWLSFDEAMGRLRYNKELLSLAEKQRNKINAVVHAHKEPI
jgi:8-oxo-dGTP pyrophosphatase MutT (NUDIX family)